MYKGPEQKLIGWITDRLDGWREHRSVNYDDRWREYERLWRGIWTEEDKTKQSERARIISPATQQAIETVQAEIEEAVFGNGKEWFDIEDDPMDQDKTDIMKVKYNLQDAFKKDRIKKYTSQVITLGHVYGTGIGELQLKTKKDIRPAQEPIQGTGLTAVGSRTGERIAVELRPIVPFNFLIDPNALDIEDAMGCAVEEYVSIHIVLEAMEKGNYQEVDLSGGPTAEDDLERTQEQQDYQKGRVKLVRYYGLIPKQLLEEYNTDKEEEYEEEGEKELSSSLEEDEYDAMGNLPEYDDMVEAHVVIANGCYILRAVENPYMMEDRPFVVYRPDIVPGRFWGRGTAERGYNMQKALDGQIRAHLDHVALTAAPMMGIDATRMPKGFKFTIQPGRSILTNGVPSEILNPITFGQTNPVNIETAQLFERFLLQATGTVDASGMPSQVSQQTDQGAVAMSLSGIIKKNKRTLLNFNEDYLVPLIQKAAWRYMQFDPERFPAKDLNFFVKSNMGVMAREYEQQQYIGLMQTLGPDSPITPILMAAIVENSGLSDKDALAEQLRQMSQPDPEAQKRQQEQEMLAKREVVARVMETEAKAMKAQEEAKAVPMLAKAKMIAALSNNLDENNESKDFERRMRLMEASYKERELNLKQMDIESNERIARLQTQTKEAETRTKAIIETMKV